VAAETEVKINAAREEYRQLNYGISSTFLVTLFLKKIEKYSWSLGFTVENSQSKGYPQFHFPAIET
jgi:hypothetical protein